MKLDDTNIGYIGLIKQEEFCFFVLYCSFLTCLLKLYIQ